MCMDNCIKRYENKIVLVTGASRGIGAAIAARFAKEGAVVIVNYSGNDEAADRTVENILAANGKAEKYKCQVDSYEETEKMITYIMDKYKRIDTGAKSQSPAPDSAMMPMPIMVQSQANRFAISRRWAPTPDGGLWRVRYS